MPANTFAIDFSGVDPAETAEPAFKPSPQQEAIYDWVERGQGNGMIVAVAGAGKTTTLIEALSRMSGTVAFAAYNTKIADEIRERVAAKGLGNRVSVKTFHAFAFAVWRRRAPRVKVEDKKSWNLIEERLPQMPRQVQTFAVKLVSMLKQSGYGFVFEPDNEAEWDRIIYHYGVDEELRNNRSGDYERDEHDTDDLLETGKFWARRLMDISIETGNERIDFDDMLFLPLYHKLRPFQYDWVLIDEAQDTNPARLAMAAAMRKWNGRVLAVGDPRQAIYGFSGADSASLDSITRQFQCKQLALTVSYRCPQAVVRFAQQWSPEIEAADNAPEGRVDSMGYGAFMEMLLNSYQDWRGQVILCRNNKPIVELAFELIRNRVSCHVEGRDIGGQIKALATKWKVNDLATLEIRLKDWRAREVKKLLDRKKESRADVLNDRVETLLVFMDGLRENNPNATISDLIAEIDALFQDNSSRGLKLSSIHKSKGREWETVYWLGRNQYQPSPFARQDWQKEQEANLMYVAATRAQVELIEVVTVA